MKTIQVILMVMASLCALTYVAPPAEAQVETLYFCTDDGSWNDDENWFTTFDGTTCSVAAHAPGTDDHAIIIPNVTCVVDGSGNNCNDVEVRSGATVNIAGATLQLRGQTGAANTSDIDGTINLQSHANASTLQVTQQNHTLLGDGKIVGQGTNAELLLGANVTLFSETTIEGIVNINVTSFFTGNFTNKGIVNANASGTILLDVDMIDDDATGVWKVTAAGATLRFASQVTGTAAALDGDFDVQAGTLDVDSAGFETTGTLTFTGGTVDCSGLLTGFVAKFTGS